MKALFLGNVAADTARGITAELPSGLQVEILADPQQLMQSPAAAVDADIVIQEVGDLITVLGPQPSGQPGSFRRSAHRGF